MPAEIRTPRQRDAFPPASPGFGGVLASAKSSTADSSAWSKLQPAQVRELREGFQTLDRDSDGLVVREDVLDMFAQLGRWIFGRCEIASY